MSHGARLRGLGVAALVFVATSAVAETSTNAFLSRSEITLPARSLAITSVAETAGCGAPLAGTRFRVDGDPSDWAGQATWIAGTGRIDRGEYVWTDYPFDDDGSDAFQYPGEGQANAANPGTVGTANAAQQRYGSNAADVVELRVAADDDHLYFLVRLNFLNATDSTIVGLGLDLDGDDNTGFSEWPRNAKLRTPGLDLFVTAWGECAVVTSAAGEQAIDAAGGAIAVSTNENVFEIALPRSLLGSATSFDLVGGSGLRDPAAEGWWEVQALPRLGASNPGATPRGKLAQSRPNVFNLLFRDDEVTENACGGATYVDVECTLGNPRAFMSERQHEVLREGTTGSYGVTLDLAAIDDDGDATPPLVRKGDERHFIRVYRSRINAEGVFVSGSNALFLSRYQPYAIWVPDCYGDSDGNGLHDCHVVPPDGDGPELTWATNAAPSLYLLHGGGGSHVSNPPRPSIPEGGRDLYGVVGIFEKFEDRAAPLLVSHLGRGQRPPWWRGVGEADVLEVVDDVAKHYDVDSDRRTVSGASLGGYGTFRIGSLYPDLWAVAAPHCSATHENSFSGRYVGNVDPATQPYVIDVVMPSLLNVTVRHTAGTLDPLTPVNTNRRLGEAAFAAGLDAQYTEYVTGGHCFDLSQATKNWMENHVKPSAELMQIARQTAPSIVRYRVDPRHYVAEPEPIGVFDVRDLGFEYAGAYWVEGLRLRAAALDSVANGSAPGGLDETVVGRIEAVSHARGDWDLSVSSCGESFGLGGPSGPGGDPTIDPPPVPSPHWWRCQTQARGGAAGNVLELTTANLEAAVIRIDDAGLDGSAPLAIEALGDGSLDLELRGIMASAVAGDCVVSSAAGGGSTTLTLDLGAAACSVTVTP